MTIREALLENLLVYGFSVPREDLDDMSDIYLLDTLLDLVEESWVDRDQSQDDSVITLRQEAYDDGFIDGYKIANFVRGRGLNENR